MRNRITQIAVVLGMVSASLAAHAGRLPEFMSAEQLAAWRAQHAAPVVASAQAPDEQTSFFTGKPYDATSGTYLFKYRAYRPMIARWTSADPNGFPDGVNNYAYIRNDPTRWMDTKGLSGTLAVKSSSDGVSSWSLSGHGWVAYRADGTDFFTTYGTWGNNPPENGGQNGLAPDIEASRNFSADVTRSMHLDDLQEGEFLATVDYYQSLGDSGWSLGNPCSGFAADAWLAATGEQLDGRSPTSLKKSGATGFMGGFFGQKG